MKSIRSLARCWYFALVVLVYPIGTRADQVELLIDTLVSKGLLTQAEADEIAAEMAGAGGPHNVPVQDLAQHPQTRQPTTKSRGWHDRLKLQGDVRVRYQGEQLKNAATVTALDLDEQRRWRIRWRVGAIADVSDRWEAGFGLASGGSDARSTNQTLRGAFSTGDARLDYAYAKYQVSENVAALGGKFKNPLWRPKDLLWDSDIRPDGFAIPMEFSVNDRMDAFVTPAYFVLSEYILADRKDAAVGLLQAGAKFAVTERISLQLAPAYYDFVNLKGTPGPLALNVPSNSRDDQGLLIHDYRSLAFGGQLDVAGNELIPQVRIFGEWVTNLAADDADNGWLAGLSVGDARVAGWGDWQVKFNHRRLEADAWPEFLTDSDHFFGATNVEGSEFELVWGLARGVNLSLDYYAGVKFLGTDVEQDLIQVDLNVKW